MEIIVLRVVEVYQFDDFEIISMRFARIYFDTIT